MRDVVSNKMAPNNADGRLVVTVPKSPDKVPQFWGTEVFDF